MTMHAPTCMGYTLGGTYQCTCGAETMAAQAKLEGRWYPNRDYETPTVGSWRTFIERCGLASLFETREGVGGVYVLFGQDGWAFSTAIRFQNEAYRLAKLRPEYYWSSYYLLWLLIERARKDMTFLEALEALGIALIYGDLTDEQAGVQLTQMGAWP